tara:strand:+ start:206 stop:442 length:237 start_codon:yes stop_codon:yes gene_type:complete
MRPVRKDIWKSGEMPPLTWCVGFNVEAHPRQKDEEWPTNLAIYVNYRGMSMILNNQGGTLHKTPTPQYWLELEVPGKE